MIGVAGPLAVVLAVLVLVVVMWFAFAVVACVRALNMELAFDVVREAMSPPGAVYGLVVVVTIDEPVE
jgi:uncharacterized membrane protein